jgi:hypothetical protein
MIKSLTIISILLFTAGAGLMLAEWVGILIYVNSPCPENPGYYMACDKVIGYEQFWNGLLLIGAGGILLLCNWVIYPARTAVH